MTRKLTPGKLVIASHNAGKVREIRALLEPYGIEPVSAGDLGLPEPEETGTTFRDNALLKAHASASASGLPALAGTGDQLNAHLAHAVNMAKRGEHYLQLQLGETTLQRG